MLLTWGEKHCEALGGLGIIRRFRVIISTTPFSGGPMKNLILLSMMGIFIAMQGLPGLAEAKSSGTTDTGPGCGWGKIWWAQDAGAKTKGVQILMATSNGMFGNQTFGISSGTLGCTNDGKWWAHQKTIMFAELNYETLTEEIAQGRGEHLASLATLMGIPHDRHALFFALAQERYESLRELSDRSPATLVDELSDAIEQHPGIEKVALNH